MRSDSAVCKYCGLVALASTMVRLEDGEYVYRCMGCAAAQRGADAAADASSGAQERKRP